MRLLLDCKFGNEFVYAVCETALADQAVPHLNQTMKNNADFFLSTGDVILHRFHRDRLLCYNHIKESLKSIPLLDMILFLSTPLNLKHQIVSLK